MKNEEKLVIKRRSVSKVRLYKELDSIVKAKELNASTLTLEAFMNVLKDEIVIEAINA